MEKPKVEVGIHSTPGNLEELTASIKWDLKAEDLKRLFGCGPRTPEVQALFNRVFSPWCFVDRTASELIDYFKTMAVMLEELDGVMTIEEQASDLTRQLDESEQALSEEVNRNG